MDGIDKLYQGLSAVYDLGTPEEFRKKIADEEHRKKLYEQVSPNIDLGVADFPAFSQKIDGYLQQPQEKQPSLLQSIGAHNPYPIQPANPLKAETWDIDKQNRERLERIKSATLPMSDEDKQREAEIERLGKEGAFGTPNGISITYDKRTGSPIITRTEGDGAHLYTGVNANQSEIDRLINGRPDYMRTPHSEEDIVENIERAWITNTKNGQKAIADAEQRIRDLIESCQENFKYTQQAQQIAQALQSGQIDEQQAQQNADSAFNELYGEVIMQHVQEEKDAFKQAALADNQDYYLKAKRDLQYAATNKVTADAHKQIDNLLKNESEPSVMQLAHSGGQMMRDPYIHAAQNFLYKAEQRMNDMRLDKYETGDFAKNVAYDLGGILESTATFGLSDLADRSTVTSIFKKVADAASKAKNPDEIYNNPELVLNDKERAVYTAYTAMISAEMARSLDTSYWADAAKLTADMIPFMLEVGAMNGIFGGINRTAQEGISRGLTRSIVSKLPAGAKKTAAKMFTGAITDIAGAGLYAGESAVMSLALPRTYANMLQKEIDVDYNALKVDNDNLVIGGFDTKSTPEAFMNAWRDQWKEMFTETGGLFNVGANVLFNNPIAKRAFYGIKHSNLGGLIDMFNTGKFFDFAKQVGYHGTYKEWLEEVEGTCWDYAFGDKDAFANFFSRDTQIPMLISFTVPAVLGGGINAGREIKYRMQFKNATNNILNTIKSHGFTDEDFADIKKSLYATPVEDLPATIANMAAALTETEQFGNMYKDYAFYSNKAKYGKLSPEEQQRLDVAAAYLFDSNNAQTEEAKALAAELTKLAYAEVALSAFDKDIANDRRRAYNEAVSFYHEQTADIAQEEQAQEQAAPTPYEQIVQDVTRTVNNLAFRNGGELTDDTPVFRVSLNGQEGKQGYIVSGESLPELDATGKMFTNNPLMTIKWDDDTVTQHTLNELVLLGVSTAGQRIAQEVEARNDERAVEKIADGEKPVIMTRGNEVLVLFRKGNGILVDEHDQEYVDTQLFQDGWKLTEDQEERHPNDASGVTQMTQGASSSMKPAAPNIDTMSADEYVRAIVEDRYKGNRTKAQAIISAKLNGAKTDLQVTQKEFDKFQKKGLTSSMNEEQWEAQYDKYEQQIKGLTALVSKLEAANIAVVHYKTQAELQEEAERKAREAEMREQRRQLAEAEAAGDIESKWQNTKKTVGFAATKTLPNGQKVNGHYILTEAGDVIPSHDPRKNYADSEGYVMENGQNVNDNNYKDPDVQRIALDIAQNYGGQAVEQMPFLENRAGRVLSGNNRTISGIIAAENNTDQDYLAALTENAQQYGFTPEQLAEYQHPRLQFVVEDELPFTTATFAMFNQQEKKTKSSVNRAVANSKMVTEAVRDKMLEIMDQYDSLDSFFGSEIAAADIVQSLINEGLMTQQEVAGLTETTDKGFKFNQSGKEYVTDMLLGTLFDEDTIRMLAGEKSLKQAILRALPSIVENRRLKGYELTSSINSAIKLLYEARKANEGKSTADAFTLYLRQVDAFDGSVKDRYNGFDIILAGEMANGVERTRELLNIYNNSARDEANGQMGFFESRDIEQIKQDVYDYYAKRNTDIAAALNGAEEEGAQSQSPVSSGTANAGEVRPTQREQLTEYLNGIADEEHKPILFDNSTLVETLRNIGATPDAIAEAEGLVSNGGHIEGFYLNGYVCLDIDNLPDAERARTKYVHERQHDLTRKDIRRVKEVMDVASESELKSLLEKFSNSPFYNKKKHSIVADEFISFAMEEAYKAKDDAELESALRAFGVKDELIDIIKSINNEQRGIEAFAMARRNTPDNHSAESSSRESSADSGTQSGGGLGREGSDTNQQSVRRTESGGRGSSKSQVTRPTTDAAETEIGGALVDRLGDMGLNVSTDLQANRDALKAAKADKSDAGAIHYYKTPSGQQYGFSYKGKVYLDPTKINAELPLHEYGHLWSEAMRRISPESWRSVVDTIKADQASWDFVRELRPELTDENEIAEEVIATFSGKRGAERLRAEYKKMHGKDADYKSKWGNIFRNISKAIQDFWKAVGDFLNIKYQSAEQVYDQVLKDFVDNMNPWKRVSDFLRQRDAEYVQAAESGDIKTATNIFYEALKENIGNGITPYMSVGTYNNLKRLAKGVKTRDAALIKEAADLIAPLIPDNAVLIPAPSHSGTATDMLDLAKAIAEVTGSEVADVLRSAPRESQYQAKKTTGIPMASKQLGIAVEGEIPADKTPIIIDNVVDSGNTAEACVQAVGKGVVVTLADSAEQYGHAASLKSAAPVLRDKDGKVIPLSKRFDLSGSRYLGRRMYLRPDDLRLSVSGTQVIPVGEKTLVGLHNISAEKLRKVMKAGGLANPSAAVIDIAKQDHHDYGEVSLVLPSSLVERADGTYPGDAWTPMYPPVEYRAGKDTEKRIKALTKGLPDNLASAIALRIRDYMDGNSHNSGMEYLYLKEQGRELPIEHTPRRYPYISIKQIADRLGIADPEYWSSDVYQAYEQLPEDQLFDFNLWLEQNGNQEEIDKRKAMVERWRSEGKDAFANTWVGRQSERMSFAAFDSAGYRILRDERDAGEENTGMTLDKASYIVDTEGLRPEFETWLQQKIDGLGYEEVLFGGYTPSGNRRWLPNTVENASKLMNQKSQTNYLERESVNETKAMLMEKFRTLAQIRKHRDILEPDREKIKAAYEAVSSDWNQLGIDFRDYTQTDKRAYQLDDNPFIAIDTALARIQEAMFKADPIAFLNREYRYSLPADSEFGTRIREIKERIKNLPSRYFETKFRRPVYLDEFANAVVPVGLPQDLRAGLENAGLRLFSYDPNAQGSRRDATLEATAGEGIRFSISSAKGSPSVARRGNLQYSEGVLPSVAKEMESIKNEAVNNGTFMQAPNGKPTNLDERQWLQVRLRSFKRWFGDWENDPKNASKVVDENGEPMVVYHTSPNEFYIFDKSRIGEMFTGRPYDLGFYFTNDSEMSYGRNKFSVFLNIKDPLQISGDGWGSAISQTDKRTSDLRRWAKEQNNDGISVESMDEVLVENNSREFTDKVFVAFEPNQIKSATNNDGSFSEENDDIRFSISNQNNDIFYSNAERAVEGIKQEKATPEQWRAMIEKAGGLKAGEDKWIGLSDWLAQQRPTVTPQANETRSQFVERAAAENKRFTLSKQDLLDYIREHKIQIEEVEYGDTMEQDAFRTLAEEYREVWDELRRKGGLTPDELDAAAMEEMNERHGGDDFSFAFNGYRGVLDVANDDAAAYYLEGMGGARPINDTRLRYTTYGLENKREIALTVPTIESWNESDEVHFGDAGEGRAVAWVRFGDTTDEQGNKTLVIDEIQSKRHQEGREKGYKGDIEKERLELLKRVNAAQQRIDEIQSIPLDDRTDEQIAERDRLHEQILQWKAEIEDLRVQYLQNAIPAAPFEKNWHELAMKRILRFAAENGYDKVAWTTGDQQARRYDLGKQLDELYVYYNDETGLYDVSILPKGGDVDSDVETLERGLDDEGLKRTVGKDLYNRVMEEGKQSGWDLPVTLADDDLVIGTDGMRGFYDDILPRFMQKYGKKWGVQVGEVTMPQLEDGYQTMHSVDITPEMRESVLQGQPMFSITGSRGAANIDKMEGVTTRMDNLAAARQMEENGKDAKTIRMATGWERGADGKWRYEIDDVQLNADNVNANFRKLDRRGVTAPMVWYHNKFTDIIADSPERKQLLAAYPQLADLDIEFYDYPNKERGAYSSEKKKISINRANVRSVDECRSVFLHEIQHAIQEAELFAKGTSKEQIQLTWKLNNEVHNKVDEYFDKMGFKEWLTSHNGDKAFVDRLMQVIHMFPNRDFNIHYLFVETLPRDKQIDAIDVLGDANDVIQSNRDAIYGAERKGMTMKPDELYHNAAGEVESRNVQNRMNLTPEERRERLLAETEDVAREDQVVIMNAFDMANDEVPQTTNRATSNDQSSNLNDFDDQIRFSVVTSRKKIAELEAGEKIKVYRAAQVIDGKLYPPMAAKQQGQLVKPIELGRWEQAEEHPELAKDGKFKLDKANGSSVVPAAYNPYFHTSRSPLNDQFSSAYDRPNLVTLEVEVPASELTSGYKAEGAKDAVGETSWHSGAVSGKLAKAGEPRKVILSRWDKPLRIVPDAEVAEKIAGMLAGKDIAIPYNVVTPSLRAELEKQGVTISDQPSGTVKKPKENDEIRFSVSYDPRGSVPKVRGGWTKEKILRYLKQNAAMAGTGKGMASRLISEFDSPAELKDHMFYHGTVYGPAALKPSITMSERDAERYGGGGYGDRYWGISLTKDKKIASNFSGTSRSVKIYPVILAKNANVIERPDFSDAYDLEDHIVELWEQGVDAVWIGEGKQGKGEQELCVLNPRAICVIDRADWYDVYNMANRITPLKIVDDEHIEKMYNAALEYQQRKYDKPRYKGHYPMSDEFKVWEIGITPEERAKRRAEYEAALQEYRDGKHEFENTEEAKTWRDYEREVDDTIRFSVNNPSTLSRSETVTKALVQQANNNYNIMQSALKKVTADLKGIRAAMRMQSDYDRKVVDALLNLYNTLLQENGVWAQYMPDTTRRIATQIVHAIGKQNITEEVNTIMDHMVHAQAKAAQRQWDKLRQTPIDKINISGVVMQGKVALEGQHALKAMNDALQANMTIEQIEEQINQLMDMEDNATDESLKTQYKGQWIGLTIAAQHLKRLQHLQEERQQLDLELQSARSNKALKPAARQQLVDNIKQAMRDNYIEQAEAYTRSTQDLSEYVNTQEGRAKDFIHRQDANRDKIRSYAQRDLEGLATNPNRNRTRGNVARSIWDAFASPIRDLQSLLRLTGLHAPDGEGYLYNHFMRNWMDGADMERTGIVAASKTLDEKIAELTHGKYKTWEDAARKINDASHNMFGITMLNGVDGKDMPVTEEIPLNAGNALYIYAVNKMNDGRMKLNGMNITEEDVQALVDKVREQFGQEILDVVDWVQSEFFSQLRKRYNPTHEALFGAPMDAIENYFPLRINANARQQNEDLSEPDTDAARLLAGTSTGAIKRRTRNSLPLDVRNADFFQEVIRHISQMERWNAFAQWNRDANILFSDINFRNRIKGMKGTIYGEGDKLYNYMKDAFRVAIGTYKPKTDTFSEITLNMAKGVTSAKINFRIFTALKQIASFPAFFTYMQDGVFVGSYLRNWLKPHETMKWAKENLPNFEKRVSKRDMGDMRLMQRSTDWQWNKRILEWSSKYGMFFNVFFDTLTCATGARAVYDSHLADYMKKGYSEEDARNRARQDAEQAFNTSQQSSEGAFMSAVQQDRNLVTAALTVFRTSPIQYTRNFFYHTRNLLRKFGEGKRDEQIAFRMGQYKNDGLNDEQARKAAEKDYNKSLRQDIVGFVVYGALLNILWRLAGQIPYLLLGDDDDKKKQILDDATSGGAWFSPFTGLLGGGIVESALDGNGSVADMFAPEMPFTQDIKRAGQYLSNDKYAEFASQALSVLMQSGTGFDPLTASDMVSRIVTTLDSEEELDAATQALRVSQALLSIPQSQYEQMLIDKVVSGETDEDAALEDYIRYQKIHTAPLTWWLRGEESDEKAEENAEKRFNKLLTERDKIKNPEDYEE